MGSNACKKVAANNILQIYKLSSQSSLITDQTLMLQIIILPTPWSKTILLCSQYRQTNFQHSTMNWSTHSWTNTNSSIQALAWRSSTTMHKTVSMKNNWAQFTQHFKTLMITIFTNCPVWSNSRVSGTTPQMPKQQQSRQDKYPGKQKSREILT